MRSKRTGIGGRSFDDIPMSGWPTDMDDGQPAVVDRIEQGAGQDDRLFTVIGQDIALGPLRPDLEATYDRWRDSFADFSVPDDAPRLIEDSLEAWYDEMPSSDDNVWFTIYELQTGRPIGVTGVVDIDTDGGAAEFFLHIGELDCQSTGYGAEVGRLMRDYAFHVLGLQSLFLVAYDYQLSGLEGYELAGFREFNRERQAHLLGGRLWDVVYMECQSTDYHGFGTATDPGTGAFLQ